MYIWELVEVPEGSAAELPFSQNGAASGIVVQDFYADLAGDYVAQLTVTNQSGLSDACQTTLEAVPAQNLWVEMFWSEYQDDMDLHLLAPGGSLETRTDCYYSNCTEAAQFLFPMDWGVSGYVGDNPILDVDERTRGKTKKILNKNKIKVRIGILNNEALDFYKSYFLSRRKSALPFVDAKIAISKDFYSVNKKKKWITNEQSRSKVHLIRSRYDCILSTYKSVNKDNSKLDCRIKGLEHLSPARVIIDRNHKLKKKLDLFKSSKKIKTYVVIGKKNTIKENFLKKKNIKIIKMYNNNKYLPYEKILLKLKRMGFTRILCESGFKTTNSLIKKKLIYNLYVFNSSYQLGRYGYNSYKYLLNKLKFKKKEKININLFGDELHKFKIK